MNYLWSVFLCFSATVFAAQIEFTATELGQVDQLKLGMKFDDVEKIYGTRAQWKQGANEPYLVVHLSKTCDVHVGSKEYGIVDSIVIPQPCIKTFDGIKHGDLYGTIFKDKEPSWLDTPGEFQDTLFARIDFEKYSLVLTFPIDDYYWKNQFKQDVDTTSNLPVKGIHITMPSAFYDAWYKKHPVDENDIQ